MAGISPVVTRGFLFTPGLAVTAGYGGPAPSPLTSALYAYIADTKRFTEFADARSFTLVATREDLPMEHVKYLAETYVLGIDFVNRLRTGQTIATGNVIVLDATGADISNTIVDTSNITVSTTKILFTLRPAAGSSHSSYQMKVKANTAADIMEQDLNLTIV